MSSRDTALRPFLVLAATALLAGAHGAAHAGALVVRDTDSTWSVTDDPAADANDFLLRHLVNGTLPDPRFGRGGQTPFTLNAANDPPAAVRVDATRRVWMVGAAVANNQPQPVVARFLADGNIDLRWGVQGKLQISPGGLSVKPNDLLPLADGSVLVAGEITGLASPRAAVFHLNADGSIDRAFGSGGVWQRAGDATDSSTATSLVASGDGRAAVAVAVRGAKPGAELWAMTDIPPVLIQRQPLDANADGEDLRADWQADHWVMAAGGGPTPVVPPALLTNREKPVATAASGPETGEGGFNPFTSAASAPSATTEDEGLPWGWIAPAVVLLAVVVAFLVMRARKPMTVLKKPPSY